MSRIASHTFQMKKWITGILLFLLGGGPLLAQGDLTENPRIFYRNERSIGVLVNSNGWGVSGRYAKRLNARNKLKSLIHIIITAVLFLEKPIFSSISGEAGENKRKSSGKLTGVGYPFEGISLLVPP